MVVQGRSSLSCCMSRVILRVGGVELEGVEVDGHLSWPLGVKFWFWLMRPLPPRQDETCRCRPRTIVRPAAAAEATHVHHHHHLLLAGAQTGQPPRVSNTGPACPSAGAVPEAAAQALRSKTAGPPRAPRVSVLSGSARRSPFEPCAASPFSSAGSAPNPFASPAVSPPPFRQFCSCPTVGAPAAGFVRRTSRLFHRGGALLLACCQGQGQTERKVTETYPRLVFESL